MLLTRSIRRKMTLGLAVLLMTLGLLSIGGLSGLSKYKRMVKELDLIISTTPRNADLVAAIMELIGPLSTEYRAEDHPQKRQVAYQIQRTQIEQGLKKVEQVTRQHFDKLEGYFARLSATPYVADSITQQRKSFYALKNDIEALLIHCEHNWDAWEDPRRHQLALSYLLHQVAELSSRIKELPEPAEARNVQLRLEDARNEHKAYITLVWVTSLSALMLFLGLAYFAYRVVVTPIRALHRGASRVAAGDFDFRIDLNTNDEISDLAAAFNHMTERFQSIAADLDRQVQQQTQQLVQSAKLAGVGFLAAGVAHEINNPLHAIATAAEGLEYRLNELLVHAEPQDAAIIREYLQMMQTESSRCRSITEKLLDFARGKDSERNQYDVTAIVRDVVSMLKHVGKFRDRNIRFDVNQPYYAFVNGSEIKQVALNIIANAVEATNPGGNVFIGIRETPDWVEVTCSDDGCGMTANVLEHLFEPFYTTKQSGKGTGLGLSISHRIVRDHDGLLEAASEGPGRGSTFRIRLPRRPKVVQAAA
ncbi:MAG: HAMP domain-containing histidine kinase [Planctomycetaceae bacterium]|nr:HAMP domain-containing histidine kinase [Planctomycetaceae bacterium]